MKEGNLRGYGFNLYYASMLVEDVPDDLWCAQPAGVPNHPAWVLGHLCATGDFAGSMLGLEPNCPTEWGELFGNGSTPTDDASRYPDRATLLAKLKEQHERVAKAYEAEDDASLAGEFPIEPLRQAFPTIGDGFNFLLVGHEALHLGQLSAWRRAAGLASIF